MLDIVRSTRALDPPPTVTLLTEADDEVVLWTILSILVRRRDVVDVDRDARVLVSRMYVLHKERLESADVPMHWRSFAYPRH